MEEDIRFIQNPFAKIFSIIQADPDKIYSLLLTLIQEFMTGVEPPNFLAIGSFHHIIGSVPQETYEDISAYTGSSGYTYTLIRLMRFFRQSKSTKQQKFQVSSSQIHSVNDSLLNQITDYKYYEKLALAQNQIVKQKILSMKKRSNLSFFMSEVCTWLCGMHLGFETANSYMFKQNQARIHQCYQYLNHNFHKLKHQVLYGTPGFLYALLELQEHYDKAKQPYRTNFSKMSMQLTQKIVAQGVRAYEQMKLKKVDLTKLPDDFRLIYLFGKKQYLGGAHGLAGNLNIILLSLRMNNFQEKMESMMRLIHPSIIFLLKHFINSNFSTSAGSTRTKLVHFCHGAPGVVYCLARYYQIFPQKGIQIGLPVVIERCLDHIWQYGILKKGFGLCHGISGNAYPFIAPVIQRMFPEKVEEYHKKATLFVILREQKEVLKQIRSFDFPDRFVPGKSDYPFSLMVGIAGDICFVIDTINKVGRFPGFDF